MTFKMCLTSKLEGTRTGSYQQDVYMKNELHSNGYCKVKNDSIDKMKTIFDIRVSETPLLTDDFIPFNSFQCKQCTQ